MQERSEAERRAIWPCLNVATWRRERSDEPHNKYDKIRPHSIRSLQFDQKVRPLSFRPEKFDLFTATRRNEFGKRHFGKNMAADVSAKKYTETSQAKNICRNVSYDMWGISRVCTLALIVAKPQLPLRSLRDLRSR